MAPSEGFGSGRCACEKGIQGLLLKSPEYSSHLSVLFRNHHARWLDHLHQDGVPHWRVLLASFVNVRVLKQFYVE